MSLLDSLRHRLGVFVRRGRFARELDEKIVFHLSLEEMHRGHAAHGEHAPGDAQRLFVDLALYTDNQSTIAGDGEPERLWGEVAGARYLTTLGVRPFLGRNFVAEEDRHPGGPRVAMLADELWKRRYNADPAALGRTREIGIRVALGASRSSVLRLIVQQGLGLALIGGVIGLVGALAGTRVLPSLLFGVAPSDPATFGAIVVLLVAAVCLASWIPARRAANVQPVEALRLE